METNKIMHRVYASNSLYKEIADSSSEDPTTTADPRFIKLTDISFVRIDNPKSPKFSTVNPFCFPMALTLATSRVKVSVGVIE
jgi:hypothetical protein